MEKILFLATTMLFCSIFHLNTEEIKLDKKVQYAVNEPLKIDHLDTVIFDLNNALIINNKYIDVPTYIKSDDDIFSLDFSLKFNNDRLFYDTILDHTGYIQLTEYFNPIDATVRFTSNSFTKYKKDSFKIVSVRFSFLAEKIEGSDLNSIMAYLNGESCSIKVLGMRSTTPNSVDLTTPNDEFVQIFPNPANDIITFWSEQMCTIEIIGLNGATPEFTFKLSPGQKHTIPVNQLTCGIYFAKIKTKTSNYTKSIVIN